MSARPPSSASIQLEEDIDFQQREWSFKRIAWGVFALVLAAAALGLFGPGLLGASSTRDARGLLDIEYHRFGRLQAPAQITLTVQPGAVAGGQFSIWFERRFIESISDLQFSPEAERSTLRGDQIELYFNAAGERPATILMQFKPSSAGWRSVRAGLGDGEPIEFGQFIHP